MAQFYYLLGAGASVEIIPTVRDFSHSMKNLSVKQKIINITNAGNFNHPEIKSLVKNDLENESRRIQSISNSFESFGSPDIYAKYLFANSSTKDLSELKHYLTIFIQLMEYFQKDGKPDQRYFEFIAQLIDGHKRFPKNVVIANWNYDNQFELAMKNFSNELQWNANIDRGHTGSGPYPPMYYEYKINGGAYFTPSTNSKIHIHSNIPKNINDYDFILSILKGFSEFKNYQSGIKFAFENDSEVVDKLIQKIETIPNSSNTTYLTIIGYSFPVFNREVDKQILNALLNKGLRRIYIQDPNPEELKRKIMGFFDESDKKDIIDLRTEFIGATFKTTSRDGLPFEKISNYPFHIPMEFTPVY